MIVLLYVRVTNKTTLVQSRRDEIKQKAARLFRKKGYQATSMREIADVVGIKAASIYNHINSKQELLEEMLLTLAQKFTEGMEMIDATTSSPSAKLEELIALHVQLVVDHTDEIALIAGEWVHLDEPAKTKYITLRDEYESAFKEIIEDGKAMGLFKEIDTDLILFSTLSTLRWLYSWYNKNKSYDVDRLKSELTQCIMNGFCGN